MGTFLLAAPWSRVHSAQPRSPGSPPWFRQRLWALSKETFQDYADAAPPPASVSTADARQAPWPPSEVPVCLLRLPVVFCVRRALPPPPIRPSVCRLTTVAGTVDTCCVQWVVINTLVISRYGQWKLLQAGFYILLKCLPRC